MIELGIHARFNTDFTVTNNLGPNRATISRKVKRGNFLAPVSLGGNPRWHRASFEAGLTVSPAATSKAPPEKKATRRT